MLRTRRIPRLLAFLAPACLAGGEPSVPTILGQGDELLVNGMRRGAGDNRYGFPMSFNPF